MQINSVPEQHEQNRRLQQPKSAREPIFVRLDLVSNYKKGRGSRRWEREMVHFYLTVQRKASSMRERKETRLRGDTKLIRVRNRVGKVNGSVTQEFICSSINQAIMCLTGVKFSSYLLLLLTNTSLDV